MKRDINKYDGFKPIANYSNYLISEDGRVLSLVTGKILQSCESNSGYKSVTLTDDSGHRGGVFIHRLLMKAFRPLENYDGWVVDHKDGDRSNNSLKNLRWVSVRENIEHTGNTGAAQHCIPVIAINRITAEEQEFPSATACGKFFNLSKDQVYARLDFPERYPHEIYLFKRKFRPCKKRPEHIEKLGTVNKHRILLRNLQSEEIREFDSLGEMLKFVGLSYATFSISPYYRNYLNHPVLPGFWQMKLKSDPVDWREPDYWKEISENHRNKRVVEVIDVRSGKLLRYFSVKEAAANRHIPLRVAYARAASNGDRVFGDGTKWGYYPHISNSLRCPSE